MSDAARLLAKAGTGAPVLLRARASEYVAAAPDAEPADALAVAAGAALSAALGHGRERAGALDLLAADLLVTLALATQAERNPGGLAAFAAGLRAGGGPA